MSLLELRDVCKTFHALGREPVKALRDVNLTVEAGTITGLVGESGSGKTTIIKSIMGLERPTSGTVTYDGINIPEAKGETLKRIRREVQFVFQDPTSSLNPRMTVEQLVGEGLLVHKLVAGKAQRRERVAELLTMVGLSDRDLDRYPRSFSGGQRQRIAIARALAVGPKLLVCDEPVSALDVSVQAQVLNLLQDMQEELGFTVLFIAHDLAVVRQICSRVAVIQLGQIVEEGPSEDVLAAPSHPYTQALLAAVPTPNPAVARARALARLQEKVA
ncbi:ATP-binding cassette domain-containing protein [Arthrobacter sp. AZCC_0090]|uniref:ATP-binding cassette domain-containing protein n=1 Tax=Arthrobacter sp. AZCC_0090 TaxID=2735881 RepID=UPI00161E82D6|nr:ATP-binding cassette domain-containing protein [Arthrobacter sp. AZCC_0090]MBB6405733.1 peptide/nickel transport system ATP-binding protein/oligopeptide transport system ATP-binding protein [Arthrobacter sp. AZCC_0090]